MEKTLVLLKPSAVQRGLMGEILHRFERKGIRLAGIKMIALTDELLDEHYAHLVGRSFYGLVKKSMKASPVIACCYEGVEVVQVVRTLVGPTNGRVAPAGTIRGDFSMSGQENVIHASDSPENGEIEVARFFKPEELFSYDMAARDFIYSESEQQM